QVDVHQYARRLFGQVHAVYVSSRAQAIKKVTSAEVLAAVVIPADIAARVSSGTTQARLEVVYNGDALEQSLVQSQLGSALAQANLGFSEQIQKAAAQAIDLLLKGGNLGVLGAPSNLIGLRQIPPLLHRVIAGEPPGATRQALERVSAFADFAAANLDVSKRVLSTVGQPIAVHAKLLHGRRTPLDTFAVVVAVIISEMFVCVLLAAGGVALEREEHTLARVVRGLVSRATLVIEKGVLAAACSLAVAIARLGGALAFAARGVAIGAVAREVRAASLLAFLSSLPLAFLALVPAGAVASGLYDVIRAVSFAFPFKASLQALDAAVNHASPPLGGAVVHLAVLTLLFGLLARIALGRAD